VSVKAAEPFVERAAFLALAYRSSRAKASTMCWSSSLMPGSFMTIDRSSLAVRNSKQSRVRVFPRPMSSARMKPRSRLASSPLGLSLMRNRSASDVPSANRRARMTSRWCGCGMERSWHTCLMCTHICSIGLSCIIVSRSILMAAAAAEAAELAREAEAAAELEPAREAEPPAAELELAPLML